MKKQLLVLLIPFLLLAGCATGPSALRHDVAVSYDAERIAYDVAGEGETALIFVHGWSCGRALLARASPRYSRKTIGSLRSTWLGMGQFLIGAIRLFNAVLCAGCESRYGQRKHWSRGSDWAFNGRVA